MKIDGKSLWIFSDSFSESYQTDRIVGFKFENEWLKIEPDGTITVKGSPDRPFSWDGCTPKWVWWDIVLGTPDGVVDPATGRQKTRRASKFHDALNQFAPSKISRKSIDLVFYDLLKAEGFKPRYVYYYTVRIFGRFFMKNRAK